MKPVLIDTNILVDHLRGNAAAVSFLSGLIDKRQTAYCSTITRIELLAGMRTNEEKAIRSLLDVFEEIDAGRNIAEIAGHYMRKYAGSHSLNAADAIIAATAKHAGAILYTLNSKHFPMDDIDVLKPY